LKIDLLYIDGCPNMAKAERIVQQVLDELGAAGTAQIIKTLVKTYADAETLKFLGSPTIRVNDIDVEPDAELQGEFGLHERNYRIHGVDSELPDMKWLRDAVRKAKKEEDEKALLEREKVEVASFDAKPIPRMHGMRTFKASKDAEKGKKGKGKETPKAEDGPGKGKGRKGKAAPTDE